MNGINAAQMGFKGSFNKPVNDGLKLAVDKAQKGLEVGIQTKGDRVEVLTDGDGINDLTQAKQDARIAGKQLLILKKFNG